MKKSTLPKGVFLFLFLKTYLYKWFTIDLKIYMLPNEKQLTENACKILSLY